MYRWLLISLSILALTGCAHRANRKGIISQELPLTLDDLSEIRAGEKNHEAILKENTVFHSPRLEKYLDTIAATIAEVSTRPHLPYHVVILNDDEVNIFGGPGGYIYLTRGLLNFVESESELAGILAHEIGHIATYEYADIPQHAKMVMVYNGLLKGSEFAKSSIGTYGTALNYGLKGVGKATPMLVKHFTEDQEIQADKNAVNYLMKAGYDPRGLGKFLERISQIEMSEVERFVKLLNTHPPFQDRRAYLTANLSTLNLESGKIEFKKDFLNEVRQLTVNSSDSIVFQPELGVSKMTPFEVQQMPQGKDEKFDPHRSRRNEWF